MKLLVLIYEYPPVGGGGGRAAEDICKGLARRSHDVRVVTSHVRGLPRHAVEGGVEVRRVRCLRRHKDRCSVPEMAAFLLAAFPRALADILRWRPDLIHVHFAVPTGALAWALHLVTGAPYLLTAHLGDVPGGVPEQTDRLFRWIKPLTVPIWRAAAARTCVSSFVAGLAHKAYGVECEVVFNGLPPGPSLAITPRTGPLRLVWCGRMQVQKNLEYGLRELALAKDADWRLDIVGDGHLRREIERAVADLDLAPRVFFHGWLPQEQVEDVMRSCHALFLPSLSEGLSLVTIQALGAGLAIIGSRIGGLQDVVEDGVNGVLCDLDAPGAFAQVVRALAVSQETLASMRAASLKHAQAFALPHIIDRYEAIYRSIGNTKETS